MVAGDQIPDESPAALDGNALLPTNELVTRVCEGIDKISSQSTSESIYPNVCFQMISGTNKSFNKLRWRKFLFLASGE
jgi:hypothetical protein